MTESSIQNNRERVLCRVTIVGSVVNFALVAIKFAAGIVGHSSAMIADAIHSLSDFITDAILLIFVRISGKAKDEDHDYGHGKFETLATAIISIALFAVGAGVLWESGSKIVGWFNGESLRMPGMAALYAAFASIIFKELIFRYTLRAGKKYNSDAVVANAWHHRSDALSSIGTAAGIGGALLLGPKWAILDAVAAFVVSLFIIRVAFKLFKPCIDELLEKSLPESIENEIIKEVLTFDEVHEPHNLRTRKIGNSYAIELHIRMDGDLSLCAAHETTIKIEKRLKEVFGDGTHVAIHVEPIKNLK